MLLAAAEAFKGYYKAGDRRLVILARDGGVRSSRK
jgi:hypothetical protein